MSHLCGSTCKRKQSPPIPCETCRFRGGRATAGAGGHETATQTRPSRSQTRHATPQEIGAGVDMYFDGLSYRRTAENIGEYFDRPTTHVAVYKWVQDLSAKANELTKETKVSTGGEWVADEIQVTVGGEKYWLFNVMDSESRFLLAAYLSKERTTRAAQTAMAMARERSENAPKEVKTDGLRSYQQAIPKAFPRHAVKHVVSQGIRAKINNNLSERMQGTLRDRDKTLRGMKTRQSGQTYIDGLAVHYNFFRPHGALEGKKPAVKAGAELPFESWRDVAGMQETN